MDRTDDRSDRSIIYSLSLDRFLSSNPLQAIENTCTPLTVCYHIGYACNLQCPYCSSKDRLNKKYADISEKALCEFISSYRIPRVVISGGEPFLYPDKLEKVLCAIKECGAYTFVSTNGTQLDALSNKLLSYIDWIDISLPATSRSLYANMRKTDCFLDVIQFIYKMKQANKRIRISYTLSSLNFYDVYNLPLFSKKLGISNLRISHTYGIPNGILWNHQNSSELKARFKQEHPAAIIYTPLSPEKIEEYRRGYLIIDPGGNVYHFDTQEENKLFSLHDYPKNSSKIRELSKAQARLFCKKVGK